MTGFDCSQETKDHVAHSPFTECASKQAGAGPIIFAKEKIAVSRYNTKTLGGRKIEVRRYNMKPWSDPEYK